MSSNYGVCRLCKEEHTLCDSHIVPEFIYGPVYDKHRAIGFKTTIKGVKPITHQKGLREFMLCGECEKHLNDSYERPNAPVWKALVEGKSQGGLSLTYNVTRSGTETVDVAGVDYASFKLLLLSILWRASVAKRSEYRAVDLGSHEEPIRLMLLERDPGPQLLYPCVLTLLKPPVRLISAPGRVIFGVHTTCQFILTSLATWYFVSPYTAKESMLEVAINERGEFQALVSKPE
jgi:hypothetical protein